MANNAPIGVFDSGIGGITVVKELMDIMPGEKFIYFGDTARVPYGSREPEEIVKFMQQILNFFVAQKVKMAVVACNTMTALGMEMARQRYAFPLVGVNTGIKSALKLSAHKKIGVIATEATINSGKHVKAAAEIDASAIVYPKACPKFVPLIEQGKVEGSEIEAATSEYLDPLKNADIEALILGCTHYPFIWSVLEKILGKSVAIVDPARDTAIDAFNILKNAGQLSNNKEGSLRLCCSADVDRAKKVASLIFDIEKVNFELVDLEKIS